MLPQPLTFCRLTLMPRANFSLNIHKPLERTCSSKHKEEEEEKVKRELLNPSFVFFRAAERRGGWGELRLRAMPEIHNAFHKAKQKRKEIKFVPIVERLCIAICYGKMLKTCV